MSRTRNYASIFYGDRSELVDALMSFHVPFCVSPLHDRDVNDDGDLKKPHFHVLLMFTSVKSKEQAQLLFSQVGCVGCEIVSSKVGYARYLCHLDDPEKAKYSTSDVFEYLVDYLDLIKLNTDRYDTLSDMIDFIEEHDFCSFRDLVLATRVDYPIFYRELVDNSTYFIREYLKSRVFDKGR